MRFRKVYLEISNICNLSCRFCPGTKRPKKALSEEEFSVLLPQIRPYTDYLYFHLMGEPLLHKQLARFLELAGSHGFKVILTTNGTLLKKQQEMLLASPALHKIMLGRSCRLSSPSSRSVTITIPFWATVRADTGISACSCTASKPMVPWARDVLSTVTNT